MVHTDLLPDTARETTRPTRNVDPKVAHYRGKVAGYASVGDHENAERCRAELQKAKLRAAAKAAADRLVELRGELTEAECAEVRALLGGA